MDLLEFVPETLLILIVATNVIGVFLKRMEIVKDKYIVFILMAFSVAFSLVLEGVSAVSFLQGVICWGVAVGLNQSVKQFSKGE